MSPVLPSAEVRAQFHEMFRPLAEPHRFKVLKGGRGGMKSWAIAQQLVLNGSIRPLRWLCARETQNSIRESVLETLKDSVMRCGLGHVYDLGETYLRGHNGTEFLFVGLREQDAQSIKSYENCDGAWLEEAQTISKRSRQILIPTIRKAGSEIWVSMNPDLAEDDAYQYWIQHPPPGAIVIECNWRDNPWLSAEARADIEYMQATDPDTFAHVYDGATRSTVEGAIYKAEIAKMEQERRICEVPYDSMLPVRTFWDLGWADLVSIWFVQQDAFRIRVIDYYEDRYKDTDFYLKILQGKGYTYSADPARPAITWPWDAASKMTRNTMEEAVRAKGFGLRILESASRADGIDAVRRLMPRMYFDADRCRDGLSGLRRYQWGPPVALGQARREPLHDAASHPADALRTLAMDYQVPAAKEPPKKHQPQMPQVYAPFG